MLNLKWSFPSKEKYWTWSPALEAYSSAPRRFTSGSQLSTINRSVSSELFILVCIYSQTNIETGPHDTSGSSSPVEDAEDAEDGVRGGRIRPVGLGQIWRIAVRLLTSYFSPFGV